MMTNRFYDKKNFKSTVHTMFVFSEGQPTKVMIMRDTGNPCLIILWLLLAAVQFGVEGLELLLIPLLKRAINNSLIRWSDCLAMCQHS